MFNNSNKMDHDSLLSRSISIPIVEIGGDIEQLLSRHISSLEGKCIEEGYLKLGSTKLIRYSCGVLKGVSATIQVIFQGKLVLPITGQSFLCVVENNTRAGIKGRLDAKENPFVVFLAKDHHAHISNFSDIKENTKLKVNILGQRFEINDPKISIIAVLEELYEPDSPDRPPSPPGFPPYRPPSPPGYPPRPSPTGVPESPYAPNSQNAYVPGSQSPLYIPRSESPLYDPPGLELVQDIFVFKAKSKENLPGNGVNEVGNPKNYPELSKKVGWRKQLSHFDVAEFQCDGSPEDGIVFPPGSRWKTLEHYWQASKIHLADKPFSYLLRVGEKYGNGDGMEARELRKGKTGVDKHPVILTPQQLQRWEEIQPNVMYIGAKAKFSQNPDKLEILCATKNAKLLHDPTRVSKDKYVHFTHYEKVRSELCKTS